MNGILGSYNLYSNLTQSVAQCTTDRFASVTVNLCNRSELETCYVDIAVTSTENAIGVNSRYIEYNTRVAPNTSFYREGILVSAGEYVTLVYRGEDPRCLTATVWGIESGEDQGLAAITRVVDPAPVIATTSLPDAEQGLPYSQQIVATDNREISSYAVASGALPTGLSLDTTTGVISGAPSGTDQDYTFTVRVTDNTDEHTDQELTITKTPDTTGPVFDPIEIETPFRVTRENSYTVTASDPSTPVTFSITSGTLPTGLTFNNGGVLSGTPNADQVGDYPITVTATDAAGNTTDLSFTLEVLLPGYETLNFVQVDGNLTIQNNNTDEITTLFKGSGSAGWNQQAYTEQIYTYPVTLEFEAVADNGDNGASYKQIALSTSMDQDSGNSNIDHAAYPYQQNTYVVRDRGSNTSLGSWNSSEKFYLTYTDDGLIQHWNGSTKLYESAFNPGLVGVDTSFYAVNSTWSRFNNIRINKAMWDGTEYIASSLTHGTGLSSDSPIISTYDKFSGTAGQTYWIQPPGASTPFQAEYSGDDYRGTGTGYFRWWRSEYRTAPTVNFYNQGYQWNCMLIEQDGSGNWANIGYPELQTFDSRTDTTTGTWGTRRGYRVFFGQAGGHGIYNTSQNVCSWSNSSGAIGAGYDGSTCGSFPNDLIMGTGTGSATYTNRTGTYSFWFAFS